MKPGLEEGNHHKMKVKVTADMFAQFEGRVVHPVYSTVMMVYHMEWVSRQIILPFLEEDEEGMGAEVKVKHLSPASEGAELLLNAKVIRFKSNVIVTDVQVRSGERLVGSGVVTQVVLEKNKIDRLIKDR